MSKLKLYVWEEFSCDWTCGIAFAIAESKEEAKTLCTKAYGMFFTPWFDDSKLTIHELTEKTAYAVSGGG